jgi:hypothetical protein
MTIKQVDDEDHISPSPVVAFVFFLTLLMMCGGFAVIVFWITKG